MYDWHCKDTHNAQYHKYLISRIMKVYELLTFNKELLERIHSAGIKAEDYKYVELYEEYGERLANGEKVTYIVASLAIEYSVSERNVYNIINKLGQEIICCKSHAVE